MIGRPWAGWCWRVFCAWCFITASQCQLYGQGELLRWKLHVGQKLSVESRQNIRETITREGRPDTVTSEVETSSTWVVIGADQEQYKISQTIDRLRLKVTVADETIVFDSNSRKVEPRLTTIKSIVEPIIGARIIQTMNSRGQVSSVDVPEKILQALAAHGDAFDWLTPDTIKDSVRNPAAQLPMGPVELGDSWKTYVEQATGFGRMKFEHRYQLAGEENVGGRKLFRIRLTATAEMLPLPKPTETQVKLTSSKTAGEFLFDQSHGYFSEFAIDQTLNFKITRNNSSSDRQIQSNVKTTFRSSETGRQKR